MLVIGRVRCKASDMHRFSWHSCLLALCFSFAPTCPGGNEEEVLSAAKKVVFLGDSITYGGGYVAVLEAYFRVAEPDRQIEILNLGVPSETLSGLSEPGHAGGKFPRPDLHERLDRALIKTKPDVIVACYGMNCGIYHPFSTERFRAFVDGVLRLRAKAAASGAEVIHLTPPVFDPLPIEGRTLPAGEAEYRKPYHGYNEVLDLYSAWLLAQRGRGWNVLDPHGAMTRYLEDRRAGDPAFTLAKDGVHMDAMGHWLAAREILVAVGTEEASQAGNASEFLEAMGHPKPTELLALVKRRQRMWSNVWLNEIGHLRPGMAKGLPLDEAREEAARIDAEIAALSPEKSPPAFSGKQSDWHGFARFEFEVDGKLASVVTPEEAAPGRPWVWHGEFFGHKPKPDIALLNKGFHIVYLRIPDMLGCPDAVAHWNALYKELTGRHGLAPKTALVGLSRGGLYCYNWAAANPEKVACIYGDAPVCDFKSWPGGFGKGNGSPRDWKLVLQRYGFASDAEARAYKLNPVDNLAPLAKAGIPLLHVYGDADEVVPWEENTGLIAERYEALGGEIQLIPKPGVGHHPHGLDDPTPIVNFILKSCR